MIYRHYKGGLYFLNGYATPFSEKFYNENKTSIEVIEVVAKAKYEPTLEDVDVVVVYDKDVKSTYYAYRSDNLEGVMCFYRGLDGQSWLRPREDFHKEIDIATQRFEKVSGENLFDIISEIINK